MISTVRKIHWIFLHNCISFDIPIRNVMSSNIQNRFVIYMKSPVTLHYRVFMSFLKFKVFNKFLFSTNLKFSSCKVIYCMGKGFLIWGNAQIFIHTLIQKVMHFSWPQPGCQWLNSSWPGMVSSYVDGLITSPSSAFSEDLCESAGLSVFQPGGFHYIPFPQPGFFQDLWKHFHVYVPSPEFSMIFPFPSLEFFQYL